MMINFSILIQRNINFNNARYIRVKQLLFYYNGLNRRYSMIRSKPTIYNNLFIHGKQFELNNNHG